VPLSCNLGTSTSWNPLGHSRPVTGLLYLYLSLLFSVLIYKVCKVAALSTIIWILWLIRMLTRGNCNSEALSDLCTLGPSQMVIPFNTMVTRFVIIHNCPHITEYYYYCNDLWLFFFSEPIISNVSVDFVKFIISHNLKYHYVISDVKAIYFSNYAEVFHRISQPKFCTQIYFCPRVLYISNIPSLVIQFPCWVDRTHNPQEINFRLTSPKNAEINFKIF